MAESRQLIMTHKDVQKALRKLADQEIAEHSKRFFKTGRGEYGEGDEFHGIRVPEQRKIARKFRELPLAETEKLLRSEYHEERLTALFILVDAFERGGEAERKAIFELYLQHTEQINNWDLVDSSAPKILGPWLEDKDRDILYKLARSKLLWERRIAMMTCLPFIRSNSDFEDALNIAGILLDDDHDLIHKAVGWMLREIGNISLETEEQFLAEHYRKMPRTMLRYAIEKFPEKKRKAYLEGTV